MNISPRVSKIIRKFEKHYGKENLLNDKYFILKKECDNSGFGLFAYYINFISEIEYALANGMTPVVDMKNYKNSFQKEGDTGLVNSWELFFEQPCGVGLEEALLSKSARYVWSDIPDFHPNDSLDFLYNDDLLEYYHKISEKYLRFNSNVLEQLKNCRDEIIEDKKCVGVLARGTDYSQFKPYYNPIQPSVEQMIPYIDKYMERYNCTHVFVATEDEAILEKLKQKYGPNLLFVHQKRFGRVNSYLYDTKEFEGIDTQELTLNYLKAIYCLSKCEGLVAGRTSGTVGACIMADSYSFKHIFTYGRYGIEDKILANGVL